MINWHLEQRKISELKDYHKNPRRLTKEQYEHLKTSLEKYGLIDKPIINLDNTIIGGHQRKNTLKKLGHKQIECWVPDRSLTEKEIEELNVRLNKNTGEWDWDILANQFEINDLLEWGFTADELVDSVQDITAPDEEESEILEPAKDEDATTKLGDVYELNNHRLICGDSKNIENFKFDAEISFTSPPYNLGKSFALRGKNKDNAYDQYDDNNINWYKLIETVLSNCMIKSSYQIFNIQMLAGNKISIIEIMHKFRKHFAEIAFWKKKQCPPAMAEKILNTSVELILIFCNEEMPKRNIKTATFQRGTLSNIFETNSASAENEFSEKHGAIMPVQFAKEILQNFCSKSIIDPFLGCGTTLIAAEQLERTCYGIELSPAYCDIIVNRWAKYMTKNNRHFTIKRNAIDVTKDYGKT